MKQSTLSAFVSHSPKTNQQHQQPSKKLKKSHAKSTSDDDDIIVLDDCEQKSTSTVISTSNSVQCMDISNDDAKENRSPKKSKPSHQATSTLHYFENLVAKRPKVSHMPRTIGGCLMFKDKIGLPNESFGDIMSIVESYNCFLKLYETIMDADSISNDIKLSKIDFHEFIDELLANKFDMFYKIVETLLRIILNDEEYLKKCFLLDVNLEKAYRRNNNILNRLTMQEFCRIFIQLDEYLYNDIEHLGTTNFLILKQINCFSFEPHRARGQRTIIESLHQTDFEEMDLKTRVSLVQALCRLMLNASVFSTCLSELQTKINDENQKINELASEILDYETRKANAANIPKGSKKSKIQYAINNEYQYEKKLNKIEQSKDKKNGMKDFLNKCERLTPIGKDNEHNTYWIFENLPYTLVRENCCFQPSTGYAKSTWYTYTTLEDISDLIKYVASKSSDSKLIKELQKFEKDIVSNKDEEEKEKEKEKEREEKKAIVQAKYFDFIPKRSTRSAASLAKFAISKTSKKNSRKIQATIYDDETSANNNTDGTRADSNYDDDVDAADDDNIDTAEADDYNDDVICMQKTDLIEAHVNLKPSIAVYKIVRDFYERLLKFGIVYDNSCYSKWNEIYDKAFEKKNFEELKDLCLMILYRLRKNCFVTPGHFFKSILFTNVEKEKVNDKKGVQHKNKVKSKQKYESNSDDNDEDEDEDDEKMKDKNSVEKKTGPIKIYHQTFEHCIKNSKISSNMIFAIYLLNMNIKWPENIAETICNVCLEKSLCSIEANLYVVCSSCSSVFHQKCVQYESTRPDAICWTCDDCGTRKFRKPVGYTLVEEVEESPSKKTRDLEAQTLYVSNYGLRKNRKQNEYSENITLKLRKPQTESEDSNKSNESERSDRRSRKSSKHYEPVITERALSLRNRGKTRPIYNLDKGSNDEQY